jgi:hypothetical protein
MVAQPGRTPAAKTGPSMVRAVWTLGGELHSPLMPAAP